jgi:hypothetical protein
MSNFIDLLMTAILICFYTWGAQAKENLVPPNKQVVLISSEEISKLSMVDHNEIQAMARKKAQGLCADVDKDLVNIIYKEFPTQDLEALYRCEKYDGLDYNAKTHEFCERQYFLVKHLIFKRDREAASQSQGEQEAQYHLLETEEKTVTRSILGVGCLFLTTVASITTAIAFTTHGQEDSALIAWSIAGGSLLSAAIGAWASCLYDKCKTSNSIEETALPPPKIPYALPVLASEIWCE